LLAIICYGAGRRSIAWAAIIENKATQPIPKLTETDYLALDRAAEYKSEFLDGEMSAMSGLTQRHSRLGVKIACQLELGLQGSKCITFNSNMRMRTPQGNYFYPDASVVCGPLEAYPGTNDVCTNPMLIAEVLSPSTANYDRSLKFERYRAIASFKDYLIIHSDSIHVEHYSRQPDDSWVLREYRGDAAIVPLPSLQCELGLGSIYAGVMELAG
jgi:Uma2 family endonuclease